MPEVSQASYLNPSLFVTDSRDAVSVSIQGMNAHSLNKIREVLPWNIDTFGVDGDVSVSVLGEKTFVTREASDHSPKAEWMTGNATLSADLLFDTIIQMDHQAHRAWFRQFETMDPKKNQLWGKPLHKVLKVDLLDNGECKIPLSFKTEGIPSIVRLTEKDNHMLSFYNRHDEPITVAIVHWAKKDKDVDLCRFTDGKSILQIPPGATMKVPLDLGDTEDVEGAIHYLMFAVGDKGAFSEEWTSKLLEYMQPNWMEEIHLPDLPLTKKWGFMTAPVKFTDYLPPKPSQMEELD